MTIDIIYAVFLSVICAIIGLVLGIFSFVAIKCLDYFFTSNDDDDFPPSASAELIKVRVTA